MSSRATPRPLNRWRPVAKMGSAWRKGYSGMSTEEWLPPADPERPRGADAGRSPEATRRRRERKQRDVWSAQPARAVELAPAEPPAPPDFTIRLPDSCSWGDGRYARWLLPTHSGKDGLSYKEVMEIQLAAKRRRESEQA
jgi:hypothetical protein